MENSTEYSENNKKYNVAISNFEGPLDLLCFLISKNKMDIFRNYDRDASWFSDAIFYQIGSGKNAALRPNTKINKAPATSSKNN